MTKALINFLKKSKLNQKTLQELTIKILTQLKTDLETD